MQIAPEKAEGKVKIANALLDYFVGQPIKGGRRVGHDHGLLVDRRAKALRPGNARHCRRFDGGECDHNGRWFAGGLIVFTDHRSLAGSHREKGNVFRVTVWRVEGCQLSPLVAHQTGGDLRVLGRPRQIGAGYGQQPNAEAPKQAA